MKEITDSLKEPFDTKAIDYITLLNFDETLTHQLSLQKLPHEWIDFSDIHHKNGFCEETSLKKIRSRLQKRKVSKLSYIGSGNYHYVTYLFLERINRPFSLILFDHHSDLFDHGPLISCGSWVKYSLYHFHHLNKVVIIGVNEEDYHYFQNNPIFKEKIMMINEQKLYRTPLHILVNDIREHLKDEKRIYISVDKDVLNPSEAVTNWDQGSMSVVQMLYIIEKLLSHYSFIGMDVCGEFIKNIESEYKFVALDRVKMNEIVNVTLAGFIKGLSEGDDQGHSSSVHAT
ncbi:arginase family protein [Fervidibacillus halotolerans]|uniref:Arginase family protein n=1 Tax=Fervidibacillus halotolerans TaxID=2980027 RepID=A0A9E8RYY2_9BACI|nr:arginase family protein [Fervidibacillus halotolerans]WAA12738.1 arginase family protein [Fervidibacillus halotolerans]